MWKNGYQMAHFLAKLCGVYVSSHVGTHMNLFFFWNCNLSSLQHSNTLTSCRISSLMTTMMTGTKRRKHVSLNLNFYSYQIYPSLFLKWTTGGFVKITNESILFLLTDEDYYDQSHCLQKLSNIKFCFCSFFSIVLAR